MSLPESTKQLIALKQIKSENVEISVNPTDLVMRGTIYQNSEAEQNSCPSSNNQSTQSLRERYFYTYIYIYIAWNHTIINDKLNFSFWRRQICCRYSGGGFVKKSFPFPKLSLQRRRRLMALGSTRERMLRKHKKREKDKEAAMGKSQEVREARYRKARKLLKNAIAKVKTEYWY